MNDLSLEQLLDVKINVASSKALDIFNTPSTVSVIDRKTIERYNFNTVAEALITVSGFEVMRTYLKRNIPTSRDILQPNYSNKTLVLVNGVAQWNAVTGETTIDRININDVERIEVLKGPASVLYGTNAYSGAVNIVLREYNSTAAAAHIAAGSNGILQAGGNVLIQEGDFSSFISANAADETGHDFYYTDENKVSGHISEYTKTNSFNTFASFRDHSLLINRYITHESFLGNIPQFASGAGRDHVSDGYLMAYNYFTDFAEKFDLNYGLSYDFNQRSFARSSDGNTRSNVKGERVTNKINLSYIFSDELTLDFGADYDLRKSYEYKNYNSLKDSVLTHNNINNRKTYEFSGIAQAHYRFSNFNLIAGSRFTKNELFGNNISSKATLVFLAGENQSIKLIAGQSFRTPSLFELYFQPPTNTTYGNTSLKPETCNSYEIAYLIGYGDFFIQTLGYFSVYQNKIFRIKRLPGNPADNSTIYTNGGRFDAFGVEVESKYSNPSVADCFLNYSYSRGNSGDEMNGDGNYNFRFIPFHTVTAGFSREVMWLNISGIINYRGESRSLLGDVDAGLTIDLNLSFRHGFSAGSLTHNLSVKNVSNNVIMFPEYTARNMKDVPSGYARRIYYELNYSL